MRTTLRARGDWLQFIQPLRELTDFNTAGGLRGRRGSYVESYGRLTVDVERAQLQSAQAAGTLEYVVYSYATPIAWRVAGTWHETSASYSVTTTKHQTKIGAAISVLSNPAY